MKQSNGGPRGGGVGNERDAIEQRDERDRLPLPSEDTGDLVEEPISGQTDDYLVAREEGVPYRAPTERVISEAREAEAGPDAAGTADDDAGELERADLVQPPTGGLPTDDELLADCLEALRASDVAAGDRIRLRVDGASVTVSGEVESVEILDEILAIVGDVRGVESVRDEVTVSSI
jgi:osmotically-inducible protein OsmY